MDSYLKIDLPDIPYGLQSKLKIDPRGDGIWILTNAGHHGRGLNHDTITCNDKEEPDIGHLTESSWRYNMWRQQTDALIKHYANRIKNNLSLKLFALLLTSHWELIADHF